MALLEITGLGKTYGEGPTATHAVGDVTLSVDEGEFVADAAIREAKEETELDIEIVELFHVYSDPKRDPRTHTMSTVFIARAKGTPKGGDDAASYIVCKPDALPGKLVFAHNVIVNDYLAYKQTGKRPPPRR